VGCSIQPAAIHSTGSIGHPVSQDGRSSANLERGGVRLGVQRQTGTPGTQQPWTAHAAGCNL